MTARHRPILGNSCARAASAAEMRFRIDRTIRGRRGARVIGLDPGASAILERVADSDWGHARFFSLADPVREVGCGGAELVALRSTDGHVTSLLDELAEADMVMLVATTDSDSAAATIIGATCTVRAITTAGLVIGSGESAATTVAALRPHARVLMTTEDEQDIVEVLTALRA